MPSIFQRARSGWNAFLGRDPTRHDDIYESGFSYRPDYVRYSYGNGKSIVSNVYNRIAVSVAAIEFKHAKVDENGQYISTMDSYLNDCINIEANVDQTGRAFIQDIVESMLDEGTIAVVPTDTDFDPTGESERFDIFEMRVGRIIKWMPSSVMIRVYNEKTGMFEDIRMPKSSTAIITNPFYSVMNEPNSTLQRLIRTIHKLDKLNDETSNDKFNMIISLPYVIRTEARRQEAEKRRKEIENQLANSKYGVAYTEATEHVTQLNRPIENNLWAQVKELTVELYNELGLTQAVIDGTADEQAMINFYNNTIVPICSAICDEFIRKFLSKTARAQNQSITFFRDPFKLVPVSQLADIADKFRRNEIMSSNEIRATVGMKPSDAQNADELRNPNLNAAKTESTDDSQHNLQSKEGVTNA
ncbi:phage portal protein [Lachnoclostridium sp. Marseille-P6806]|uniref:phage portal protein n=1 Tax=Lachnoclostridium sp. Marseille-P6806 TaxID=2364793 RepID=UPI00103044E2|nr:phage portal protein [Lachnoclostridium sp. Marseille-P6806]